MGGGDLIWSELSMKNLRSLMAMFNSFVNDTGLRELHRHGGDFTWPNKKSDPIMVVLDRVFVSADWEITL